MSLVKNLITKLLHKKVSRLDELYQRHAGEECYIFGDGISIKWMDLKNFSDKPVIIGGFMMYHKNLKDMNVLYSCLIEPNWFWPIFPYGGFKKLNFHRNKMQREYRKTIKDHSAILFFVNISNFPVLFFKNILYVSRWYKPPFLKNNNFVDRNDSFSGTFKFQISLAIFMGFKKAYLVGHDYTHHPSKSFHFYEKGEGVYDYEATKDFCKDFILDAKNKIELIAITLDAKGEFIESINYKDFTNKEPSFRENVDLVSKEKLDNLATWPGYTIY